MLLVFVLQSVCDRLDIEYGDRLSSDSYKRKFLVTRLPEVSVSFPLLIVPVQEENKRLRICLV